MRPAYEDMNSGLCVVKPSFKMHEDLLRIDALFASGTHPTFQPRCKNYFSCFDDQAVLIEFAKLRPHQVEDLGVEYNFPANLKQHTQKYGMNSSVLPNGEVFRAVHLT